jgi:4-hydroxyacetophenone monooxygenase
MVTNGFPNLFFLYGPNTNLAHGGSIYFHAECQARYIAQCLVHMLEEGFGSMEIREDACAAYCQAVDEEHAGLIWANCRVGEWFKNDAGRVVCVTPWRLVDYWHMTHEPEWQHFEFEPVRRRSMAQRGQVQ